MDTPITRAEHNEFVRRMEDEHRRINRRVEDVEKKVEDIGSLTASVSRLAESVERMCKEQSAQGKRLEVLEGRDGEMWRKVVGYVVSAVISIIVGFALGKIGIM